jgi:hypothetical protein
MSNFSVSEAKAVLLDETEEKPNRAEGALVPVNGCIPVIML